MSGLAIPPGLQGILGILKGLGIDPQAMLKGLEQKTLLARLNAGLSVVVARLEKDGLTPALKASSPESERQFIRSAMYLSLKAAMPMRQGANVVADFIRDAHDDQVVSMVSAAIEPTTPTVDAVRLINKALAERIF